MAETSVERAMAELDDHGRDLEIALDVHDLLNEPAWLAFCGAQTKLRNEVHSLVARLKESTLVQSLNDNRDAASLAEESAKTNQAMNYSYGKATGFGQAAQMAEAEITRIIGT